LISCWQADMEKLTGAYFKVTVATCSWKIRDINKRDGRDLNPTFFPGGLKQCVPSP